MKNSINIFKVLGIRVEMHISFLILPLFFAFLYGIKGVFIIFAIFTCVAAHELAHSIVAKNYGINVDKITLLPIGGIANMRSMPQTPGQEFAISIAGPVFNVLLTIVLFFPLKTLLGDSILFHPTPQTWAGAVAYAYWINPILAAFNLLPAFPMDGGRVLRSLLARKLDYAKATKIAVGFGHVFAVIFAFLALTAQPPNFILLFIALFIFVAASQEESVTNIKSALEKIQVADVLSENIYTVPPDATISDVLNLLLRSKQEDFPVVTADGVVVGLLTRDRVIITVHAKELQRKVKEIMVTKFPVLKSEESLSSAYNKMENSHLKVLPIIDDKLLKGVVTLEDISRVYSIFKKRGK